MDGPLAYCQAEVSILLGRILLAMVKVGVTPV